jgi:hypothetical protein
MAYADGEYLMRGNNFKKRMSLISSNEFSDRGQGIKMTVVDLDA